jgi:pimeloyl-ACP methyl ester carboxylesterase
MPHIFNGGVKIAYTVQGNGPALVLVHANPFDHRLFLYQVAQYAPRFRTIAIDIRGYGDSGKPSSAFTLRDMADDVIAVVRAEHVERAVFMGVSVGANIALLIGLDDTPMVNGLVLVGGGARGSASAEKRIAGYGSDDPTAYRRVHIHELVSPAFSRSPLGTWLLDTIVTQSPAISGASIAQIFHALNASDVSGRLREVGVPTLLVNGEFDNALPNSREAAAAIPGAEHIILPGTGHACNLEDPAAFDRVVTPFLQAHAR